MRRKNDNLALKGWEKFFHNILMLVLFPIRKPFLTIGILIVLWFLPTLIGAKPAEVHKWYWAKMQKVTINNKTLENIIKENYFEVGLKKVEDEGRYNYNTVAQRRQMFQKAKLEAKPVEIEDKNLAIENTSPTVELEPMPKPQARTKPKIDLDYLSVPEIVYGKPDVINANKLIVDNKHLFLYGIYVDAETQLGKDAKSFLKDLIADKTINCRIVAYTFQKVATGYCFVDNISINHLLVEKGFSKDIALDR